VKITALLLALLLLAGCASPTAEQTPDSKYEGYVDEVIVTDPAEQDAPEEAPSAAPPAEGKPEAEGAAPEETTPEEPVSPTEDEPVSEPPETGVEASIESESAALSVSPPAVSDTLVAEASGTKVHKAERAVIDYSNTTDGYVMVQFTGQSDKRLRTQVKGPATTYTYELPKGQWEVFPLSDGNGVYQVSVYENVKDKSYALVTSVSFEVQLQDEFAPYLLPNQYVNYTPGSAVVAKAAEIVGSEPDTLKKVELVYNYVVGNLIYDTQKAASVKSGYVPVLDTVLAEKKGICFDYAALMAAMLRSQGVPCKLIVGYAGTAYHAWISVWSPETGWVDGAIFFDGVSWQRMDPTFASSGNKSDSIMQFIGDGKNYTAKYLY